MQLPPAHTTAVRVERDLRVPMPDGVVLLADRFVARGGEDQPLVLIRSPYGRSGFVAEMWARPFAERGFQVLIQSCRGTHGSGGEFDPFHHERSDGAATLAWIKTQPWFCGVMFTFGQSYLGYTQWALAQAAGPELRAMATQVTSAHIGAMTYGGGAFMLENSLSWTRVVTMQRQRGLGQVRGFIEMMSGRDPLQRVWRGVTPLAQVDELGLGQPVSFFRDWLQNPSPDDAGWQPMDHTRALERIDKPVCMVAGWFDIFAPWQFRDFVALQAAGRDVQLTVGPYAHIDLRINALGIREALAWFRAHLNGVHVGRRAKPCVCTCRGRRSGASSNAGRRRQTPHVGICNRMASWRRRRPRTALRTAICTIPRNPRPRSGGRACPDARSWSTIASSKRARTCWCSPATLWPRTRRWSAKSPPNYG